MINKATASDIEKITSLAMILWSHHESDELKQEFSQLLMNEECAVFLAEEENKQIGFAQVQLRHDYVEGTSSSPVGYLEGIFVREEYRKYGYASKLLRSCEKWAREKGCSEFASDCELTNETSLAFHLKLGFTEANRIICFTKRL